MLNSCHHLIPFGPAFSGKGYLGNQIKEAFGHERITVIETGKLVSDRMRSDSDFRKEYGCIVSGGKTLIPDEVILPMFESSYTNAKNNGARLFWLDGIGRNRNQVKWLYKRGILCQHTSRFIIIKPSMETCRQRRDDAISAGRRNGRTDNDVWVERYTAHKEEELGVIEELGSLNIQPVILDGDASLPMLKLRVLLKARELVPFCHSM